MFRTHRAWLRGTRTDHPDQRGATLVIVAGAMLALTSAVALAVDVGMLLVARTEAQRVADLSALAGAGGLLQSPGNEVLARQLAVDFAAQNDIRHLGTTVLPDDISVDLDQSRVTVTVYRVAERGTSIGTFFARVFGVNSVDVAALATAEAAPAGGINCLLPVAVPDRWVEGEGAGNDTTTYDPELGDDYIPWVQPDTDPVVYNEAFTGYSEYDRGARIALKSNNGSGGMNSSWYYPWRPYEQSGANDYRTNVWSCVDPSLVFGVGAVVDTEPGNMAGPTLQGFKDLIDQDREASWNTVHNCVVNAGLEASSNAGHCRTSLRIRPIPLFDPREAPDPGNKPFTFTNFAGVFVESVEGKTVYARWIGYSAVQPASPGEISAGPLFKVLRLVE